MVTCIRDSIEGTVRLGDRTRLQGKKSVGSHWESLWPSRGECRRWTRWLQGWCMWWHRLEMSPVRCQWTDLAWSGQHLEGHPLIKSVSGRVSYQAGTGHTHKRPLFRRHAEKYKLETWVRRYKVTPLWWPFGLQLKIEQNFHSNSCYRERWIIYQLNPTAKLVFSS